MSSYGGDLGLLAWAILLVGFGYAAYTDLVRREAPDSVWQLLGVSGGVLGAIAVAPGGAIPLFAWLLVAGLIVEHFFAWDVALERRAEWLPGWIEVGAYAAVGIVLVALGYSVGIGDSGVPAVAVAAFAVVLVARAAFEFGLLYGGADAKALIAAAALIPLAPVVLAAGLFGARPTDLVPGPLNLLMNAALISVAVPIGIAVRNLRRGTFEGASGFVGYPIPVAELSHRFVWIRDPTLGGGTEEERSVETAEDDLAMRQRQQADLESRGITTIWVTPQLPFLVFFFAGALLTFVAGNLLFDLLARL